MHNEKKNWLNNRTLVIAWLIFFFPVGLYAVWQGDVFELKTKQKITLGIVAILLAFGVNQLQGIPDFLLIFVGYPIAVYLLWKDVSIAKSTMYVFGGVMAVLMVLYLGSGSDGGYSPDDDCVAVQTQGNCTYFRDANCVVISQQCS